MSAVKSHQNRQKEGPSTFALLVDDINKMSESEQKMLWIQINKDKLSALAKAIDVSVNPHNFSAQQIDSMINEVRKNGRKKKS